MFSLASMGVPPLPHPWLFPVSIRSGCRDKAPEMAALAPDLALSPGGRKARIWVLAT